MDYKQAMDDPAGQFGDPEKVVDESTLSREQKIKILRQWEYDARELEVAEEENMAGGPPDLLARILSALDKLAPSERPGTTPGKQGGA